MFRFLLLCGLMLFLAGCTSIEVEPLRYDPALKEIHLIENPKVVVHDFVPVLEQNFSQHGIVIKRFSKFTQLGKDEYGIRYTAKQSWTLLSYLSEAAVEVYKGNELVAEGKYHLLGRSACLSPLKWQGTETKMKPLYDELLKNYPAGKK